jgi:hypothetical protein
MGAARPPPFPWWTTREWRYAVAVRFLADVISGQVRGVDLIEAAEVMLTMIRLAAAERN